MRRRPGFTLVELIVVMAVIATLIAIALPGLSGARAEARRASCLAGLRSIGQGLAGYRNQHSGLLPAAFRAVDVRHGALAPLPAIAEYLDVSLPRYDSRTGETTSRAPWRCPADREESLADGWSYSYLPWDLMFFYSLRSPQQTVTRWYELRPGEPVMWDHEARHDRPRKGAASHGRNVLTFDGAAGEG